MLRPVSSQMPLEGKRTHPGPSLTHVRSADPTVAEKSCLTHPAVRTTRSGLRGPAYPGPICFRGEEVQVEVSHQMEIRKW
jgi:hypothetical protein